MKRKHFRIDTATCIRKKLNLQNFTHSMQYIYFCEQYMYNMLQNVCITH